MFCTEPFKPFMVIQSLAKQQAEAQYLIGPSAFVQASWDSSVSDYTAAELSSMFFKHGAVEEVIPRPAKKKNKGSALIVMRTAEVRLPPARQMGFC